MTGEDAHLDQQLLGKVDQTQNPDFRIRQQPDLSHHRALPPPHIMPGPVLVHLPRLTPDEVQLLHGTLVARQLQQRHP